MKRPRVLLADDHSLVLEGFRRLLESEFDVVGTADDGRALVAAARKLKPDVVLLDISMPLLNGIEAARQIRKTDRKVKLVFLTMHTEPALVAEAFRVGASGYVLKSGAASELAAAIREVERGRSYITPSVTKDTMRSLLSKRQSETTTAPLTARQREVLQLIAEGRANKEIGAILKVSVKTVEYHKASIMEKLGLRTTAQLTRYAMRQGLIGE